MNSPPDSAGLPRLDPERWKALISGLGLPPSPEMFRTLDAAHAQRHRHYHTAEHINACLRHLDIHRDRANRPELIEAAIWFHDAVYNPFSKTNEADSAQMAKDFFASHLSETDLDWLTRTIHLTQNHGDTNDTDMKLMLDIDLSILAAAPDVYDLYTQHIRKEYRLVPRPLYRKGRRQVLDHFLTMDPIYKTNALAKSWEAEAKSNLARERETL